MNTPTPLIIDEALPLHTYLEIINDDAFDPIFVPDTNEPNTNEAAHPLSTTPDASWFTRLLRALPLI